MILAIMEVQGKGFGISIMYFTGTQRCDDIICGILDTKTVELRKPSVEDLNNV